MWKSENKIALAGAPLLYSKRTLSALVLIGGLMWLLGMDLKAVGPEDEGKDFVRTYSWEYAGETYSFTYRIPWKTYNYYSERPRTYRNYAVYTHESKEHPFVDGFSKALQLEASENGLNRWETIGFVTCFVQQLAYVRESGEYPKFPVETLADKGGDCEDSSILLATLLDRMGYDVLLVNPPGHMAVALACKNCSGPAYEKDGRKYYYIETTGTGFKVGEIPDEYKKTKDKLFRLKAEPEELWVFSAEPANDGDGSPTYYVYENGDTGVVHSGNTRILTTTIVRTITINGETYTTKTVVRRIE